MIGSEFVTEVALMLGRDDLNSNILNWVNWGMYYLDRQCDFKGLRVRSKFPFVVGQTEYSFPDDMKYATSLTLLDHKMEVVTITAPSTVTVATTIATGTRIQFLNTDPPEPLDPNIFYYAIYVSATAIKLALTSALATLGTAIVFTDAGTTPHMMEIYNGSDSRRLTYILESDFVDEVPDITERDSDKPSLYIDKGDIFEIDRPIDEALCGELVYWKWQDALSEDSSSPEVSHIEDIICLAATIFGWRALEEVQKKADAIAELDKLLGSHMKVLSRHPDEFLSDRGFRSSEVPLRANMRAYGYKYPGVKAP